MVGGSLKSRDLPGVMVYGEDRATAVAKVQALALRVLAETSGARRRLIRNRSASRCSQREHLAEYEGGESSCRAAPDWLDGEAPGRHITPHTRA
jgi:hypothetical protein